MLLKIIFYATSDWLWSLQLITMARPNIIESIDDPPYDIIGKGAPTIGNKPNTIDILTVTYMKNDAAKPKQYNLAKLFLELSPIKKIL